MKNYIIYCDESISKGKYYSNFYGGVLIDSKYFDFVVGELNRKKEELNMYGEIKWTKVTEAYLDKYIEFINLYFDFIKKGYIKIRIMFRNNNHEPVGLTRNQELDGFYLLYYQFLKHSFGLKYINTIGNKVRLRIYFDKLPNTNEQNRRFKEYIHDLQYVDDFREKNIVINKEDITDVDSKKHVLLQGMDIILGSIQFRLNREHKIVNPDTGRRGKKTKAKEKLYKTINKNIREIYPNFNIGISTGIKNNIQNIWIHPYRHWSFIPNSCVENRHLF